jgi:hypothetical protein
MEVGGRLVTRVFDHYNEAVGVCIGVLILAALVRLWRARQGMPGLRPARRELGVLSVMIAVAAAITLVFGPRTVELQEKAFASESGPGRQAAYDDFFRSHQIVRGLYMINLALGIGLLGLRARRELGSKHA